MQNYDIFASSKTEYSYYSRGFFLFVREISPNTFCEEGNMSKRLFRTHIKSVQASKQKQQHVIFSYSLKTKD